MRHREEEHLGGGSILLGDERQPLLGKAGTAGSQLRVGLHQLRLGRRQRLALHVLGRHLFVLTCSSSRAHVTRLPAQGTRARAHATVRLARRTARPRPTRARAHTCSRHITLHARGLHALKVTRARGQLLSSHEGTALQSRGGVILASLSMACSFLASAFAPRVFEACSCLSSTGCWRPALVVP